VEDEHFIPEFLGALVIAMRFQSHSFAGSYISESLKNPARPSDGVSM
jgi:hypothetical protein